MRPRIVASLGLLVAVSVIYALVTGVFRGSDSTNSQEIGDRSRAELRELLREGDSETSP